MILWSLDVRSPPLDVVAVHRVGEPLVTPLVWRTLSCYLLPVILLSVARGVCGYSNASNHRCKLRDFLDSTRCDFAVSDQLYLEKSARHRRRPDGVQARGKHTQTCTQQRGDSVPKRRVTRITGGYNVY